MATRGKYRLRTSIRRRLPWRLLWLAPKGRGDCGNHQWYRETVGSWRCVHCTVGVSDVNPHSPKEVIAKTGLALRTMIESANRRGLAEHEREIVIVLVDELIDALEQTGLVRAAASPTAAAPPAFAQLEPDARGARTSGI